MTTTPTVSISATYRLQFNKTFTFRDAAEILKYLSDIGITHVYASPIFNSKRGSTHGYDVIDPTTLNPELGDEADFLAFHEKLRELGLGLILDIVPNHMSASSENAWWMDVLENGPSSAYGSYFDIDWHPPSRMLEGKVLLPVLGRPFGEALELQELKLTFVDGKCFVQYFESLFPLTPSSYNRILKHRVNELSGVLGEASPAFQEYAGIVAAASALSTTANYTGNAAGDTRLQFESVRQRLRQLAAQSPEIYGFIQQNLRDLGGKAKDPSSFSSLERLLGQQHYTLAYWQNVNEEINYRRFFTINDLVGMRMQDPLVFDTTHALVLRMVEQKIVNGLRIDHIDGLRDPLGYLNRLSERVSADTRSIQPSSVPIFVEKILARDERLPPDWPVAGTTGYEFANALNCFFVDSQGAAQIEQIYSAFLEKDVLYDQILYQKKKLVMSSLLGVEMRSLSRQLQVLAEDDRYAREIPRIELNMALTEATAQLSLYRTYVRNLDVAARDRRRIEDAIGRARTKSPEIPERAFRFLGDVLLLQHRPHLLPGQREARLAFVMRWQQFTGPIMAKAFEDTFLYVFNPLISLNEVGGDPRPSTAHALDFGKFIVDRSRDWPHAMNATTTHDTKRGEDVRARISVLSELPDHWRAGLQRWSKMNTKHRKQIDGNAVPDRNEEIFLYQTLLGAWPLDHSNLSALSKRMKEYAIKATREAMVHTRWTRPNLSHEAALEDFLTAILRSGSKNEFLRDFAPFQERIAYFGMINGLSQTLLKVFSPGIPDFYQGSELWDLRLVDPDNRRAVDYDARKTLLAKLPLIGDVPSTFLADLMHNWKDGGVKLYSLSKALRVRRDHPALFSDGSFMELEVVGKRRRHVSSFIRKHNEKWALIVVPRWLARAEYPADVTQVRSFWSNTEVRLPTGAPSSFKNVFSGEYVDAARTTARSKSIRIGNLLDKFPVALLIGATTPSSTLKRK